jgi:hypothetical protein
MIINKSCAFQLPFTPTKAKKNLYTSQSRLTTATTILNFSFATGVEHKILWCWRTMRDTGCRWVFSARKKATRTQGGIASVFWLAHLLAENYVALPRNKRCLPYRAERAAGARCKKVLTLSRDIAFLSNCQNLANRRCIAGLVGNLWSLRHHSGDDPHPSSRVICFS